MDNNQAAFTLSHVSFSYGKKQLFSDLSLSIPEGKITTLIGANGSGKTTLFNLMTKNLKPAQGTILLREGNVSQLRLSDFAQLVAIVHQNNTAPGDITVEQLVRYGRFPFHAHRSRMLTARTHEHANHKTLHQVLREEDERMVTWALEVCSLNEVRSCAINSLSGGQRQRVWIAMSLAQGSDIVLLDEPTTYLDVRFQLEILQLMKTLNGTYAKTIIMVLHDINQAIHYSDNLVALREGTVLASGAPCEVLSEQLIEQVYGVHLRLAHIDALPFVVTV